MKLNTVCISTEEYRRLIDENSQYLRLAAEYRAKYQFVLDTLREKLVADREHDLARGFGKTEPSATISFEEYCEVFDVKRPKSFLKRIDEDFEAREQNSESEG